MPLSSLARAANRRSHVPIIAALRRNPALSLLRSLSTVGAYTLLSRILGFVRDLVLAQVFGANAQTDAFFVAFKIPNFLRRLFA